MAFSPSDHLLTPLQQADLASVWHPFTQAGIAPPPLAITRAEGAVLYTDTGRELIDAVASWWVNLHGHGQPAIAAAIAQQARQLEHVIFAGFTHRPAVELAQRLLPLLPGQMTRAFYTDNGSTAVEVALKMALQYWHNQGQPRYKLIALEGAYHGDTFGAMSVGERGIYNAPFQPLLFDVHFLPRPEAQNLPAVKRQLQELLQTGEVAAFIYEPLVQGAAGMQMYAAEALEQLLQLCRQQGVLCIADEVMTGFGRTGRLFASAFCPTPPDIICLSKGITGGFLPMGFTAATEAIYQTFLSTDKSKALLHGHSYTANPLACAAALASLDLLLGPATDAAIRHIEQAHAGFAAELTQLPGVQNVRQQGTILAFEMGPAERASYFSAIRDTLYLAFLERGVLLRPLGQILYILPPYCISPEQLQQVYQAIREVVLEVLPPLAGQSES